MNLLLAFIILILSFVGLGAGLILARKGLKRGCSVDPDSCACKKENKNPDECKKKGNHLF